jgi:beta-N-acetylhexosaminidase
MKKILWIFIAAIAILNISLLTWIHFNSTQTYTGFINPVTSSYTSVQLANMSLRQKVSSLLILHSPGTNATNIKNFLETYEPGGLILMGDNIPETAEGLKSLTAELQANKSLPYLFAVDEEGGVVRRVVDDTYPAAIDLSNLPASATQTAFKDRSALLFTSGLNLNFGIVADVTNNPNSFIYSRVFGGDPTLVGERVAAAVTASKGLTLSTLKHFPGHGETDDDSHVSIPTTDTSLANWQLRDMPPFQMGIQVGANVVMFGHLRYSSVDSAPASLSTIWHDILKNQLGFNGLTVTDDMIMLQNSGETQYDDPINNAVSALQAGNTMLLYVLGADSTVSGVSINDLIDGIVAAVQDGRLKLSVINNDVRKVINVRHSLLRLGSS